MINLKITKTILLFCMLSYIFISCKKTANAIPAGVGKTYAVTTAETSAATMNIASDTIFYAPRLLIADNGYRRSAETAGKTKRLLITDFNGNILWKFENPTGSADNYAGPLGARWLGNNKILATFGKGEVGVIDITTNTWDWQVTGFGGDLFKSPYDAELLPDGKLVIALRYGTTNDPVGQVAVFDRATGQKVWKYNHSNAHSVKYRAIGYNTTKPTLLIGGFGSATDETNAGVKEVVYDNTNYADKTVVWSAPSEWTHDAIVAESDNILLTNGYHMSKIKRVYNPAIDYSERIWNSCVKDESKRFAINPSGGYIVTVNQEGRSDCDGIFAPELGKVEFRTVDGVLTRSFTTLTETLADGSKITSPLDYAYGLQVIPAQTTTTTTKVDDADARIIYKGTWGSSNGAPYYNSTQHYVNENSTRYDDASLSFTGKSVSWVYRKGPDRGKSDVYIDGAFVTKIDLYSATLATNPVVLYTRSWGTTTGNHSIKIVALFERNASSTGYLSGLDYFEYTP